MNEKRGGSAAQPSWWRNLVPHRWGPQAPGPTYFGPAGLYASGQVEERLLNPEWDTSARSPRDTDTDEFLRALGNRSSFPPDGHVTPTANRRPYPA
jgi:hypothetical protein